MRTIDWIETRKELDAKRVGCMGISGGGTCTMFSAALEPRIKAAHDQRLSEHFPRQHYEHLALHRQLRSGHSELGRDVRCGRPDRAAAAVRGIGRKDDIFPIAASRASFARVKKVYEVFGAAALAEQETFDGPHSFWGVRGVPWVAKQLLA